MSGMAPFDIYIAKRKWRNSEADRPWLLVRPTTVGWLSFAISTKDYDSRPFEVSEDHPDFPATGLDETSYIYEAESFTEIRSDCLLKRLGRLEADLLRSFLEYSGIRP
jgi:hypothetical protein